MKKVLLLFSTLILSLLLVNNKVFAEQLYPEYPSFIMKLNFSNVNFVQENEYTYEYEVYYYSSTIFNDELTEDDYYLIISHYIPLRKGIDRDTNSYELEEVQPYPELEFTNFVLRVTLFKSFIIENGFDDLEPNPFFRDYSALYVTYDNNIGYQEGYEDGYNDGYNEGYEDGYNDFNVTDYFGDRNIAKATGIEYYLVSDAFEPSTSIVVYNAGHSGPNILLDKPNIIVIIKKNIYDYVTVYFEDGSIIYHFEATYFDIGDYNIYIFNLPERLNTKYNLEIRKENVTTTEEADEFLNDVVGNIYFSHASKLLTSSIALQFYDFGYIAGLEENISDNDAYRIGYDNGYNRGYTEGNELGYEQGFEDGYEQGFDYGKTVEYEHGYKDGYDDGFSDGIREPFFSNFHVWIVPAIIIVVVAGIFVGYRRERYWND